MTLFPSNNSKPKIRPSGDERPRRRIPTGPPRVVESSGDRESRSSADAWAALLDGVRRSSAARLELLKGRGLAEQLPCPWKLITECVASCRCGGTGTVSVGLLRDHYAGLTAEIEALARPSPARRSS